MQFVVAGLFRADAEAEREAIHEAFNEHLAQRAARTHFGGPLYDETGRRTGVLLILEASDWATARHFLAQSPYQAAGLYDWTLVSEIRPEVGRFA
jgi:uncharacterized protein YciI